MDDLGFGWTSTERKMGCGVFIQGGKKKNANGLGTGIQNRVVISYCFRGRPWIRLEIKKKGVDHTDFEQGLSQKNRQWGRNEE